ANGMEKMDGVRQLPARERVWWSIYNASSSSAARRLGRAGPSPARTSSEIDLASLYIGANSLHCDQIEVGVLCLLKTSSATGVGIGESKALLERLVQRNYFA